MKKRILGCVLALLTVGVCAVTAFGSGDRTVVRLSYLTNTYAEQLRASFRKALSGLDKSYEAAVEELGSEPGAGPSPSVPVSGTADASWSSSGYFCPIYPRRGETAVLAAGSGLMWQSGSALADRAMVDVTAGAELAAGQALSAGHRYLAYQDTVVTAASDSVCAVEGYWRTNATGTEPPRALFTDVPVGVWFYEPVKYAVEHNLFNGTGGGMFTPMGKMDRSQLVTVLYRMAGAPKVTGLPPYSDVKAGTWYTDAVNWAAQKGILTGIVGSSFQPTAPISREQIAVMFYRFAMLAGCDMAPRADLSSYTDHASITSFALESLQWSVGVGLFQGSGGMLNPGAGATRCEVATLFQRLNEMLPQQHL